MPAETNKAHREQKLRVVTREPGQHVVLSNSTLPKRRSNYHEKNCRLQLADESCRLEIISKHLVTR